MLGEGSRDEWEEDQQEMDEDGHLNGFGEKCYNCGGYGHYSRECPAKGKGKGKSKSSGEKSFRKPTAKRRSARAREKGPSTRAKAKAQQRAVSTAVARITPTNAPAQCRAGTSGHIAKH